MDARPIHSEGLAKERVRQRSGYVFHGFAFCLYPRGIPRNREEGDARIARRADDKKNENLRALVGFGL